MLACLAPAEGLSSTKMMDVFPGDASHGTVLDAIAAEWDDLWKIRPHKLVQGWREARNIYTLALPQTGWTVDIEHQDSVDALNRGLGQHLAADKLARLTRGQLTGEDRRLTVLVARWVHDLVLDDGSLPHGITLPSKHGSNGVCWAIWLRRVDDGRAPSAEPTRVTAEQPILPPNENPPLHAAAEAFGLTVL